MTEATAQGTEAAEAEQAQDAPAEQAKIIRVVAVWHRAITVDGIHRKAEPVEHARRALVGRTGEAQALRAMAREWCERAVVRVRLQTGPCTFEWVDTS